MIRVSSLGKYEIYEDDGATHDFYCRMGRYFANKQIIKELEGPMFDDEYHVWLLAMLKGEIIGFSSCRFDELNKGIANFALTYVFPDHRRKGLYRCMFGIKEQMCINHGAKLIKGLANPLSKAVFDDSGWTATRQAGKWTYYQKEVNNG